MPMDWKEIFKPPFMADEYNPGTIWASNFEMVTTPTNLMDIAAAIQDSIGQFIADSLMEASKPN